MDFVVYLGYFFLAVNTILFSITYKKEKTRSLYFFVLYSFSMVLVQMASSIIFNLGQDNVYLSHCYFLFQFVTVSLFYKQLLTNEKIKNILHYALYGIPIVVVAQYIYDYKLLFKFNLLEIFLCSFSLFFYAVTYLLQALEGSKKWVWFSSGLAIYLLCSSIVFSSGNIFIDYFIKVRYLGANIWFINILMYLGYQILITIEWFKSFKQK